MSPKLITKFVSLTRGASAVKMDKVSPHTITFDNKKKAIRLFEFKSVIV